MIGPVLRSLRQMQAIDVSVINLWPEHHPFTQAGTLVFFTIFSLAPTLIIAVTVVRLVLGQGAAQGEIVAQLQDAMGVESAAAIEQAILISRPEETGPMPTLIDIGAILIGTTVVFGQLRYSISALLLLLGVPLTRAELEIRDRPTVPHASAVGVVQQQVV